MARRFVWSARGTIAAAAVVCGVAGPSCARAQDALPSVTVALSDWGLARPGDVRFGRLALVEDSAPGRLTVYWLRDSVPEAHSFSDQAEVPAFDGNSLVVAELDHGNRNRLGGFFNGFERVPSRAEVSIAPAQDGRRALRVSCVVGASGYCGMWIHFFDLGRAPSERRYVDGRGFSTLSFWVRGERGGERYELSLADAAWERRQDARPLGELADFIAGGRVEAEWRRVVVPLDRLPVEVNRGTLASLIVRAIEPGPSRIYIRRVALSVDSSSLPPLPGIDPHARERPAGVGATWVWNTAEIIDDPSLRDRLLAFLKRENVQRAFLQLPDDSTHRGPEGEILIDAHRLRPLVEQLTALGVQVYALDGHPAQALRENHGRVLATLDNVIEYNRRSDPAQRFVGVRHDIEPYLLAGFHGPARDTLIGHYLDLVAEVARRARAAGLVYGVDIPFWYDAPDEFTYEAVSVSYAGTTQPASHHLIDLADEVAVMDYRTVAFGADGTIRHVSGELEYAAKRRVPVLVGLETFPLPDETLLTFGGDPIVDLTQPLPAEGIVIARTGGDSTRLVLLRPDHTHTGLSPAGIPNDVEGIGIAGALRRAGVDPEGAIGWPVTGVIAVPGSKLSFATLGRESLWQVIADTRSELSAYPSFAGFAIHHVWSYSELLERE